MGIIRKGNPAGSTAGQTQAPHECAALLNLLGHADPAHRRAAARDLASHPASASVLAAALLRESDRSVRQFMLTSLTLIGNEAAVAGLVQCLRSDDAALRNEAIEAMKALPEEMAPVMGGLLRGDEPDVRILAVNILESLRHPDVEKWLIEVIDRDQAVNVCATAVDLLGEVGSEAAADALLRLKQRFAGEPYIQFAAGLALKRIGK